MIRIGSGAFTRLRRIGHRCTRTLNGPRKNQGHHGTTTFCIANVHTASAGIHDAACNGEAQAGATVLLVGAPESREYQITHLECCLLYTSPSPRDRTRSRMP